MTKFILTNGDDLFPASGQIGTGQDIIWGLDGADTIRAFGSDIVYGGTGDDLIQGDIQGQHLHGGDGADTIFGDFGDDLVDGGSGNDY